MNRLQCVSIAMLGFFFATITFANERPTWLPAHPGFKAEDFDAIQKQQWIELLVEISPPTQQVQSIQSKVQQFSARKAQLLAKFDKQKLDKRYEYSHLPMFAIRVRDENAITALARNPLVKAIYSNEKFYPVLAQSLPLIQQPAVISSGVTGQGTAVAVLDTGLDYTHAAFGSCTTPGSPASCRVVFAGDFATNDGALDENGHGTNVSAIVAGVATQTDLIGLDVFDGATASSTDIVNAINWVIANKVAYNIVAINMSLGGGSKFSNPCTLGNPFLTPIANAKNAGIVTTASAGNSGHIDGIGMPACTPGAVSVGAVYDSNVGSINWSSCSDPTTAADKVTCFSNSANFLTMFAPGALISAGGLIMGGTSQAAPHVAGAMALMAELHSTDDVDTRVARLVDSGVDVLDSRNGITKPRLNLAAFLPPLNDAFASYTDMASGGGTVATSNAYAEKELNEPDHAGNAGGASVWFRYVATEDRLITFDTHGSDFDTLLAVYQGNDLSSLTIVQSNDDDGSPNGTSSVSFLISTGEEYRIAVDGKDGLTGNIELNWTLSDQADLSLALTIDDSEIEQNENTLVNIEVSNAGPHSSTNNQVTVTLPVEVDYVSSSKPCVQSGNDWNCDLNDLDNGTMDIMTMTITSTIIGSYNIDAIVVGSADDLNASNNSDQVGLNVTAITSATSVQVPLMPWWAYMVLVGLFAWVSKKHRQNQSEP